jgi:hypothetical protein
MVWWLGPLAQDAGSVERVIWPMGLREGTCHPAPLGVRVVAPRRRELRILCEERLWVANRTEPRGDRSPGACGNGNRGQRSRPPGSRKPAFQADFRAHGMQARTRCRTILGSALRFRPAAIDILNPAALAGLFPHGHLAVVYGWRHQVSAVGLGARSWEIPKGLPRLTPRALGGLDRLHREKGPGIMGKIGGPCLLMTVSYR